MMNFMQNITKLVGRNATGNRFSILMLPKKTDMEKLLQKKNWKSTISRYAVNGKNEKMKVEHQKFQDLTRPYLNLGQPRTWSVHRPYYRL